MVDFHPNGPFLSLPDRVFLALVERQEDRGLVVAQGGGKVSIFSHHAC